MLVGGLRIWLVVGLSEVLVGLGLTVVQAIQNQNLPVVQGIVILAAMFVVVANIAVDALYAVLDPRVRVS